MKLLLHFLSLFDLQIKKNTVLNHSMGVQKEVIAGITGL
jgi:hypothetical protein